MSSLLHRVITAHRCRSTHHHIAINALTLLKNDDAENWRNLLYVMHEDLLDGAKAPDTEFKDFKNHVLHVGDGEWGGARDAALEWYANAVEALKAKKWAQAAWSLGVMSHYYADPIQPFHTGQTEEEGAIHRAVEWSIAKSHHEIQTRIAAKGLPVVRTGDGPAFITDMVLEGAKKSHAHYRTLIDHYNIDAGVKTPEAGLDDHLLDVISDLVGYATAGLAAIYDRAFAEAGVKAPRTSITLHGFLSSLDIPVRWVARKLADANDRRLVEGMYRELKATGKVLKTLPDDDKAIRRMHAQQVLRKPIRELDKQELAPLGVKHAPRPEYAELAASAREESQRRNAAAKPSAIVKPKAKPAKKQEPIEKPAATIAPVKTAKPEAPKPVSQKPAAPPPAAKTVATKPPAPQPAEAVDSARATAPPAAQNTPEVPAAKREAPVAPAPAKAKAETPQQSKPTSPEPRSAEPRVAEPTKAAAPAEAKPETPATPVSTPEPKTETPAAAKGAEDAKTTTPEPAEVISFPSPVAAYEAVEKNPEFWEGKATDSTDPKPSGNTSEVLEEDLDEAPNLADLAGMDDDDINDSSSPGVPFQTADASVEDDDETSDTESPSQNDSADEDDDRNPRLTLDAPVRAAPSIGGKTAKRLSKASVVTIRDLLEADPKTVASRVNAKYITADAVADWQAQTQLMLAMPGLRVHDVQILVGADIRSVDELAEASVRDVLDAATNFIKSPAGSRVNASEEPNPEEVYDWIEQAMDAL